MYWGEMTLGRSRGLQHLQPERPVPDRGGTARREPAAERPGQQVERGVQEAGERRGDECLRMGLPCL